MYKAALYTLGCKVNQYETEAITEQMKLAGYDIVDFEMPADVYIINTCTVTGLSARKSRQIIRRAKNTNKDAIVAVTGCYPQTAPIEVESIPGVDIIIGTANRSKIVTLIEEYRQTKVRVNLVGDVMHDPDFEELGIQNYDNRTRAILKIQDGCSQFCTYCIIPYARGPVRSRKPENAADEARKLAENGFKEIVLTGIHLASYGKDLENTSLIEFVKLVHQIDGIERIRLGSVEPGTITEEFVAEAKKLHKLCPHYHLSLQSGSDETLKRMNRKYDTSFYRQAVARLRRNIPDVAISTDVIAGFPGETAEEFINTLSFVEEMAFAKLHVFKFSPRQGTPAADFKGQVSGETKETRSKLLISAGFESMQVYNKSYEGRVMPVLFEQKADTGYGFYEGHTANYIRVICKGESDLSGQLMNVRLNEAVGDYVLGVL